MRRFLALVADADHDGATRGSRSGVTHAAGDVLERRVDEVVLAAHPASVRPGRGVVEAGRVYEINLSRRRVPASTLARRQSAEVAVHLDRRVDDARRHLVLRHSILSRLLAPLCLCASALNPGLDDSRAPQAQAD
jgi:hypothetical protein